jgi:hypothetical protein
MAASRLRQMHPVLEVHLLAGPIVTFELTRPLGALVEYTPSREQLVSEVVAAWLRAMAPERESKIGARQRKDADA